jgi:hypothetical protein
MNTLAVLYREFFIAGELQPFAVQAFAHQAGKPRLENAHMTLLQQLDFFSSISMQTTSWPTSARTAACTKPT